MHISYTIAFLVSMNMLVHTMQQQHPPRASRILGRLTPLRQAWVNPTPPVVELVPVQIEPQDTTRNEIVYTDKKLRKKLSCIGFFTTGIMGAAYVLTAATSNFKFPATAQTFWSRAATLHHCVTPIADILNTPCQDAINTQILPAQLVASAGLGAMIMLATVGLISAIYFGYTAQQS